MSLLHDYFKTRNLQGFQRLLDGSRERGSATYALSTSAGGSGSNHTTGGGGGKSWNRSGGLTTYASNHIVDVNARDWLGRTVLHLVCASLEGIEYARALLKHPNIDINLADTESSWTPLHRALYYANLPVALLLLQRSDIDTSLKDLEGYTAFDLYNSTVNGTKPDVEKQDAELFTWGTNRNAALGLSDANDRTYPDHVTISSMEDPAKLAKMNLAVRFSPIHVRQIQMSKLHTAVVTDEAEGNVRLCGFGSGGRLGPTQHMQYVLKPVSSLNLPIQSVALGQDHTLALTKSGEVYSWGHNRFSALGYVLELSAGSGGRHEEPIQTVPKRIVGPLKREVVIGVAASRNASACWTKETLFTWGTNTGQLGYDKNAQPVQITPRPVTKFSNPVIDIAMSDTVLVALLVNNHVECIWNDRHYRVSFPLNAFPSGIEPYRPPQSVRDSCISKVTCCDDTFAALSSNGEVFTFSSPNVNPDLSSGEGRGFKPQRVWALRKKFSAVKDVALGSDGSIIICTESGHVFVRTRNAKASSSKTFKFERVPYLQRVVGVCANSTGAFAAVRVDYKPKPIEVVGNMIAEDLKTIQPYLEFYRTQELQDDRVIPGSSTSGGRRRRSVHAARATSRHLDDEPEDDAGIERDIQDVLELCDVLSTEQRMRKAGGGNVLYDSIRLPHGADTMVHVQSGAAFPVHRVILGARSHVLAQVLAGFQPTQLKDPSLSTSNITMKLLPSKPGPGLGVFKISRLSISGCHPLSILVLLRYLYADELLAVWDLRIGAAVEKQLQSLHVNSSQIKAELQALATMLELPSLRAALEPPVKREPVPTMKQAMERLFENAQTQGRSQALAPLLPDVVLELADEQVFTHSAILRARSPLFASFFGLEDWTRKRWNADGVVRVDLKHLKWDVMRFVTAFLCFGADREMFNVLDFIPSVENLLPFMFEVLAAANELLLERLVLLCSSVILAYCNINNACYILADATHYHVRPLIEKLQEYISVNMESFLESRILDEIPYSLVKQLAKFVKQRQLEKSPFARSEVFMQEMMVKHSDWLAGEDIPETIVRSTATMKTALRRDAAKISPPTPNRKSVPQRSSSHFVTPQPMLRRPPSGDEIFIMDEQNESSAAAATNQGPSSGSDFLRAVPTPPVWKSHSTPRVDMKTVMAEEAGQSNQHPPSRLPSVQNLSHASRPGSSIGSPAGDASSAQVVKKPSGSKSAASSTWRVNPPAEKASDSRGVAPATPPKHSPLTSPSLPRESHRSPAGQTTSSRAQPLFTSSPTTTARPQAPGPSLGPIFTPSRQTPSKSGSSSARNTSGGKAWAPLPVQPSTPTPSVPSRGMSFVAIQHSQQEAAPLKDNKRSLREIQEEEKNRQVEADFLKWWAEEEERVQQEAQALAQFQENTSKEESKSNRKPRQHKPKGKAKAPFTHSGANAEIAAPSKSPQGASDTQPSFPASSRKQQQRKSHQAKDKGTSDP